MNDELLHQLRTLEEALHRPEIRQDTDRLEALLHADFEEIGRSGKFYRRADILRELTAEADHAVVRADRYALSVLNEGMALLTYRSAQVDEAGKLQRFALRSSLWIETPDGWQVRFHQGTPTVSATPTPR